MVLCERCGKHNEDYCNYCSDEGNEMSTFERKLILNENENKYCDEIVPLNLVQKPPFSFATGLGA